MKKEFEPVSILIRGNEKNKNEIIYNNIIDKMNEMKLSKDDQVEYLKSKISILELETHNKVSLMLSIIICLIFLGLGIYFVAIDVYLFGCFVSFTSKIPSGMQQIAYISLRINEYLCVYTETPPHSENRASQRIAHFAHFMVK